MENNETDLIFAKKENIQLKNEVTKLTEVVKKLKTKLNQIKEIATGWEESYSEEAFKSFEAKEELKKMNGLLLLAKNDLETVSDCRTCKNINICKNKIDNCKSYEWRGNIKEKPYIC